MSQPVLLADSNGILMKTGDIVRIENAYCKSYNGIYMIHRSPEDCQWSGDDYCLTLLTKKFQMSKSEKIQFWPLTHCFSNQWKRWEAEDHDRKYARITILPEADHTISLDTMENEIRERIERLKYNIYHGFNHDIVENLDFIHYYIEQFNTLLLSKPNHKRSSPYHMRKLLTDSRVPMHMMEEFIQNLINAEPDYLIPSFIWELLPTLKHKS